MPDRLPARSWLLARVIRAAVGYAAAEARLAFRRNGLMSAAAVTTVMVTLILVGLALALSANLAHLAGVMEGQVEVVAYLRDDLSPAQRAQVVARVQAIPGVRAVTFVSRDQALQRLQATLGERVSLRDLVAANPLPDSLELALDDPSAARRIAAAVQATGGVGDVTFGAQVLDRLLAVTAVLRTAGLVGTGLLAAVALVIVMNTIRLTILSRRQEIEIMQLVGAGGWYVRSPFLLEGALQGAAGALLASLVLVPGYLFLLSRTQAVLPFLPVVAPADLFPSLLTALAAGGVLVGTGGSALALRRFLSP